MKWDTKRVEEKNLTGAIAKNIMKHSQEYYILAILRYLYPDRYSKVISGERPDLHSEDIGIEVTIAEEEKDMQVTREFSQYCKGDNQDRRLKTIQKSGKYKVVNHDYRAGVLSGGGVNSGEKDTLMKAICKKYESVKKYPENHYKEMELAILRTDIPTTYWMESVLEWIREAVDLQDEKIFSKIYAIGRNCCFEYCIDGGTSVKQIDSHIVNRLKKIARMTAEQIISLDDEEWN